MTSALLAGAVLLALAFHLRHLVRRSRARAAEAATAERASILAVVADARDVPSGTAGVTTFAGSWNGQHVQIRTIVDTLATRKLPALWLSVTIAEKVRVPAIFDLMMRPGSATTFSNFDHLPHTLPTPTDYPEGAVIRTNGNAERQPARNHRPASRCFCRQSGERTADHRKRDPLCLASRRSRPGALRGLPAGRVFRRKSRSGADQCASGGSLVPARGDQPRCAEGRGMNPAEPRPANPYLVLAAATFPGCGHVMLGMASRGLQFVFFMVILAWVTLKIAPADASFIGRHAGGVLIYALSILDAYRIARIRYAQWSFRGREPNSGWRRQKVITGIFFSFQLKAARSFATN